MRFRSGLMAGLFALSACAVTVSPAPTAEPSTEVRPSSEIFGSASAAPTGSPSAVPPEPDALTWERIGVLDSFRTSGLLGFEDGYVAFGTTYPDGLPGAWYSDDGTHWTWSELVTRASCPISSDASLDTISGASNGRDVVLVGVGCDGDWFAWVSSDGRSWDASPLGVNRNEGDAFDGRVLAGPDWWEVAMFGAEVTVYRSSDGIAWQPAGETGFESAACCPYVGTGPDGSRLIGDHLGLLVTSADGTSWREVDIPFTPPSPGADNVTGKDWLAGIVAPGASEPIRWILFTSRHDGSDALTWTSADLKSWAQGRFPMPEVGHMASTRFGLVATGLAPCSAEPCIVVAPRQYLSDDGLRWTPLASSVNALHVADGPAGVIAIGRSPSDTPAISVWILRQLPPDQLPGTASRFTEAEAQLLLGIRADAQVNCTPKRERTPSGLLGAVECVLDDGLVDRVFVYALPTYRDAALTYLERLAEAGVAPLTGNCSAGVAGDAGSVPGDDVHDAEQPGTIAYGGHTLVTERAGCFLDESGLANVRVTCGRTYIGVMGKTNDLAALSQWTTDHPGGVPMLTPSPLGICLGP